MSTEKRPIEEWLAGLTELAPSTQDLLAMDVRDRLATIAKSVSGLSSDREELVELWLSIVCPERAEMLKHPDPSVRRIYQNPTDWRVMSSCALAVRSHLRRLGVRDANLGLLEDGSRVPYKPQDAMNDLTQVATAHGALVTKPTETPSRGLVLIIGEGIRTHTFVVESVTIEDGQKEGTIVGIDGGQPSGRCEERDQSYQGIFTITRTLRRVGSRWAVEDRMVNYAILPELIQTPAEPTIDSV